MIHHEIRLTVEHMPAAPYRRGHHVKVRVAEAGLELEFQFAHDGAAGMHRFCERLDRLVDPTGIDIVIALDEAEIAARPDLYSTVGNTVHFCADVLRRGGHVGTGRP